MIQQDYPSFNTFIEEERTIFKEGPPVIDKTTITVSTIKSGILFSEKYSHNNNMNGEIDLLKIIRILKKKIEQNIKLK